MFPTPAVIHHHLKTCQEHHPLLIQFIFSELISGFQVVHDIDDHLKKESNINAQGISLLNSSLARLTGYRPGYSRLFAADKEGIFAKLKNYSALLSETKAIQNKETSYMHQVGNQIWILSLQAYDFTTNLLQNKFLESSDISPLLFLIKRLTHSIKVYTRILKQFIMHYRQDENVLFFLLKHQEELDKIYHPNFVASLFRKMFFRSLKRAELFIYTRYSIRGFHHLLPVIKQKFANL